MSAIDHAPTSAHDLPTFEVLQLTGSSLETGLSSSEAGERLKRHGENRVKERHGTPSWLRLVRQLTAPLVLVLIAAAVVTGILGEWMDASVIFIVVVVNAIIGFLQESKAENALEALMKMVVAEAMVRRDGKKIRVNSIDLVPGDIVMLAGGDRVPADIRLLETKSLQIDESSLTGESVPASKRPDPLQADTVLADRVNMAYAGSLVTAGTGTGVVWATGDRTETGRVAFLIAEAVDLTTPLTRKIARFSGILLWVILTLAAALFAYGVLVRGGSVIEMLMASVALAVGVIPEGLPAAITIVLAIGVNRMAKRRAIIRKLPAVETLGCTTVICSDKTGTLTQNKMTVQRIHAGGETFEVSGTGYEPLGHICDASHVKIDVTHNPALHECLLAGMLCNDSAIIEKDGAWSIAGDPTEGALLVAAEKAGLRHAMIHAGSPRVDMIPFESDHMFRATLHDHLEGRRIFKAGALERLLDRCTHMLDARGEVVAIDAEVVREVARSFASEGMRVIAFCRRDGSHVSGDFEHHHVSEGLTFLGIQGMIDPPREEAIAAVAKCQLAGIRVKMITGDHAVTAQAIAKQIGIAGADTAPAISGRELAEISDEDLPEIADRTAVFARVAPEQKLRLVRALQSRGHILAMTGDGVNDGPALKQADIGIAMGITGTDVAKGAASMVLTDDNFATIAAAVEEGRGVYDNLIKFLVWTLPVSVGFALILLTSVVFGLILPALPVHLLWVNLTTAILLGLMLVFEPPETDIMHRPPRDQKTPIFDFAMLMRTGLVSMIILAGSYWVFFYEQNNGASIAQTRTAVVNLVVAVASAYLINCRSLRQSILSIGWFSNPLLWLGIGLSFLLQLAFTYWPLMNRFFHTAPIQANSWLRILCVAFAAFMIIELEKKIRRRRLQPISS
ncbi:MAG: carbonate dehydratase [Verrucomicrobiales bacterium VVV1]|nr:MAG: carbonate dehydratase [Verrucomicrobiales bacterium VVV1]